MRLGGLSFLQVRRFSRISLARLLSSRNSPVAGSTSSLVELKGIIRREVYSAKDFKVANVALEDAEEQGGAVSVVMRGPDVGMAREGQRIILKGKWVSNSKHGKQFESSHVQVAMPERISDVENMIKGSVKGIGRVIAERITAAYGMDAYSVLTTKPESMLGVVKGMTPAIVEEARKKLMASMADSNALVGVNSANARDKESLIWGRLRSLGFTEKTTERIIKFYGGQKRDVYSVLKGETLEGIYEIAKDVEYVGFHTVDAIALANGLLPNNPARIEAGVLHVVEQLVGAAGDTVIEKQKVLRKSEALFKSNGLSQSGLDSLLAKHELVAISVGNMDGVQPAHLYHAESNIARILYEVMHSPPRLSPSLEMVDRAMDEFAAEVGSKLSPQQRAAVRSAMVDKWVIISGGPGVGKTMTVKAIVEVARRLEMNQITLCAPTGKAARKLAQSVDHAVDAVTLHQLLKFTGVSFRLDENSCLPPMDVLVVDEFSMVTTKLFESLLRALHPSTRLVLVGDHDQLPSIGPGSVLRDAIRSHVAVVHFLTTIFRQAEQSLVVQYAHDIKNGRWSPPEHSSHGDFTFVDIEKTSAEQVVENIVNIVAQRFNGQAQVLSPMNEGVLGVANLNAALQARLNASTGQDLVLPFNKADRVVAFREGDRVIQLRNDYDRNIRNGDIGVVVFVDPGAMNFIRKRRTGQSPEEKQHHERENEPPVVMRVEYDGGNTVSYYRDTLMELQHAYAITVHKAQGSEFDNVIVIMTTGSHHIMLQRNLLYTAITRGKKRVLLFSTRQAVRRAVQNDSANQRVTALETKLRDAMSAEPPKPDSITALPAE